MRIVFIFNVRHVKPSLTNKQAIDEAEFDEPETTQAIHAAIVESGYECVDVEADEDAYGKLKKLKGSVDLAFNVAEGLRGEIREAQIPAILEMLGIPYTHSGALAHAISLDKALTKKIWQYHGLPTPKFVAIGASDKPYVEGLEFPVLVKPNSEGSSKGVFNDNLIDDPEKLTAKIREIQRAYGDGVMVEEFLPGREFTVTVMGNREPYMLPIVEQNYDIFPDHLKKFASYEAKLLFEDSLPNSRDAYICPAKLPSSLAKLIEKLCISALETIHCRDIVRIDLRLDAKGKPSLLEINTLPGMLPE
jgi:D-alanine-D-alanine ligase